MVGTSVSQRMQTISILSQQSVSLKYIQCQEASVLMMVSCQCAVDCTV